HGQSTYSSRSSFTRTTAPNNCTSSLHDALPIYLRIEPDHLAKRQDGADQQHRDDQGVEAGIGEKGRDDLLVEHHRYEAAQHQEQDRKSTRLNSSHLVISYAVFCLKKKND